MTGTPALELPDFDPASLIDSLADGVYITDTGRKILLWNRAAERITGWPAAEVVGRTCFDNILCHVDKDGHCLCGEEYCPLHRSVITGRPSEAPLLVFARRKSGERVPVEVTVAPLRSRAGVTIGGVEVFRDASISMHDMLRAKAIQDLTFKCDGRDDPRIEIEVRHQSHDVIGGDYYRVERLADGRLALLVADVMGHGVPAALYTMHLASLWDHHRSEFDAPARILGVLNRRLHLVAVEAGFFATAILATYDPASGELVLARAGHPAPLLFRRDGRVETPGKARPALGMMAEVTYEEFRTKLDPGDLILLFTDGAFEVRDSAGRELGIAGLQQLVREQAAAAPDGVCRLAGLEEQLLRFSNELHLPDDLTLLRLQRMTDPPSSGMAGGG
jgi:PAS domain S-box-containing protein